VAAASVPFQSVFSRLPAELIHGRALIVAPVYAHPSLSLAPVSHLWPDSVVTILDALGGWYRLEQGYVPQPTIQPMMPFAPQFPLAPSTIPFWAEVAGPVVSIRQYCAADAPLVTRIGHGGVGQVVDFLPGEPNGWYGIADNNGRMIGWSQAVFWRPVEIDPVSVTNAIVRIDQQTCQVTLTENGEPVLAAPCAIGESMLPGTYHPSGRQIAGAQIDAPAPFHGVPWVTTFGEGYSITGVYWHNRFGQPMNGAAVQTTPLLAQWIYHTLGNDGTIIVE
jgi:hypothetical protein